MGIRWALVILLTGHFCWAETSDRSCESYLKPVVRTKLNRFQKLAPALTSRLRPAYKDDAFDVRLIAQNKKLTSMPFSPAHLLERTVSDTKKILSTYESFGFTPQYYIHTLVECHPGALKIMCAITHKWRDSTHQDTSIISNYFVGVPNRWGRNRNFEEAVMVLNSPSLYGVSLILTAYSEEDHSLQTDLPIAHELAHTTEPIESFKNPLWVEARADFLAYISTGHTEVIFPSELFKSIALTSKYVVIRSLSRPAISHLSKVVHDPLYYHINSQVFSSLLYGMSITIGEKHAVDFVKWMDQQKQDDIISKYEPKPEIQDIIYLSYSSGPLGLSQTASLKTLANALKDWAATQDLSDYKKELI